MSGKFPYLILSFMTLAWVMPLSLSAQSTVTFVYSRQDQTSSHVFDWLRGGIRKAGLNLKLSPLSAEKSYGGSSAAVFILNVSSSGLEPGIQNFLGKNKDLPHPVILNLKPNSRDTIVGFTEAAKSPQGVDAVTAATVWNSWDPGNQTMHKKWLQQVLDLIGAL